MKKLFLLLFSFYVFFVSCNYDTSSFDSLKDETEFNQLISKLDFRISHCTDSVFLNRSSLFGGLDSNVFPVTCVIQNTSNDTVCFIEYSCNGLDNNLSYDTSSFSQEFQISCNATYPRKRCLLPKQNYTFNMYIGKHGKNDKLKMGLNLIFVENKNIKDPSYIGRRIFTRDPGKYLIWSNEIPMIK
jgi:hypothetical protein